MMLKFINESGMSDVAVSREISTDHDKVAPSIVNRWRNGVHKKISYDRYVRVMGVYERIKRGALKHG